MGNRSARCSYVWRSNVFGTILFRWNLSWSWNRAHCTKYIYHTRLTNRLWFYPSIYTGKQFYCERIYAERNCEKWIGMNNCIWWLGVEYVTCAHTALVRHKCAILPFILHRHFQLSRLPDDIFFVLFYFCILFSSISSHFLSSMRDRKHAYMWAFKFS